MPEKWFTTVTIIFKDTWGLVQQFQCIWKLISIMQSDDVTATNLLHDRICVIIGDRHKSLFDKFT